VSITNLVSDNISLIRGLINDKIRTDGRDSFIYSTDNVFPLTEDFISASTIKVFKNGTQLSNSNFSYSADTNRVTVTSSLTISDVIVITYSYYKKYSDTELQAYLESSLAYFPMYQYKKTFFISGTKIVANGNLSPSMNEIYFLALIASIVVDPQNVRISIPDLNISPRRDKSDIDQIKEAFVHFKNFVGTFDFELIHNSID